MRVRVRVRARDLGVGACGLAAFAHALLELLAAHLVGVRVWVRIRC